VGSIPAEAASLRAQSGQTIKLVEPPEWRANRGRKGAERRVRAVLARQPNMPTRELAKAAKVSRSTASKYRSILAVEGQRREIAQ